MYTLNITLWFILICILCSLTFKIMNNLSFKKMVILSLFLILLHTNISPIVVSLDYKATGFSFRLERHDYRDFLTGYEPGIDMKGKKLKDYLKIMSKKFTYIRDIDNFGYSDIWQIPEQLEKSGRGDCEDMSIYLADWLISDGYDAWVVIGTFHDQGHAWVEVGDFILDATSSIKSPFFKKYRHEYKEQIRFNREIIK